MSCTDLISDEAWKQAMCDRFNARNPVGSPIRIWRMRREGPGDITFVEAPGAYLLGGHTPVVKVPGNVIALTHTEDLPRNG
jgi:hypothetical protein